MIYTPTALFNESFDVMNPQLYLLVYLSVNLFNYFILFHFMLLCYIFLEPKLYPGAVSTSITIIVDVSPSIGHIMNKPG